MRNTLLTDDRVQLSKQQGRSYYVTALVNRVLPPSQPILGVSRGSDQK